MKEHIRQQIGVRFKECRELMGWSQEEVARRLKVKRQTVSKWELGKSAPDSDTWYVIGLLFGKSLDYIVYGDMSMTVATSPMVSKILSAQGVQPPAAVFSRT